MKSILPFFLLFFLFFLPSVSAIGIAPGKVTIDFEPNAEIELEGALTNTLDWEQKFELFVEGNLEDYIELIDVPDVITVGPDQRWNFRFRISLPEKMGRPGEHVSSVWAQEYVDPTIEGMVARLKIGIKIVVRVPYPGKYAQLGLKIKNANVNDTVNFEISVTSLGKENITSAKPELSIINLENQTVVKLESEGRPIETTKTEKFSIDWFSDAEPGLYGAKVVVFYDGETSELEQMFNLGAPLIRITNVSDKPIEEGTISKIKVTAKSFWNEKIDGIYTEIFIKNETGKQVAHLQSQVFSLEPFSSTSVVNYWDTTDIPLGEYKGFVMLHYLDKNDTYEIDLEIITKPFVIGSEILFIIAAVIIAIVAILAVYKKKRKDKYRQKRSM